MLFRSLCQVHIDYLNEFVHFQVAQLSKFFDCSVGPNLTLNMHASVIFLSLHYQDQVSLTLSRRGDYDYLDPPFARITVLCQGMYSQVWCIAQLVSQFSATLSNVVHLELSAYNKECSLFEGTGFERVVHPLRQFSTVQMLHVSPNLACHLARALEGSVGENMVAEALPSLDFIFLEGQRRPASTLKKFVAARRLSDRPITVANTTREFNSKIQSYVNV